MKKILSIVLVLVMVLSLCACSEGGSGSANIKGYKVGYSAVNITPDLGTYDYALMGYGSTHKRIATGVLDYLYATCVAITDENENTILLITTDTCAGSYNNAIKETINAQAGIPIENIMMNATHTHSSIDFDQSKASGTKPYGEQFKKGVVEAALNALADRQPAEMYYGTSESEGLNFIRHVKMEDGGYKGDNFGHENTTKPVAYVEEIDETIHLIKFDRGDDYKDIIMMNWRAHGTLTGGSSKYNISADYVGSLRTYLQEQTDCLFAYYQGAAGNVNPRSYITEDTCTTDYKLYGKQLGAYALKGLEEMVKIEAGPIKVINRDVPLKVDHSETDKYAKAKELYTHYQNTGDSSAVKALGEEYGIRSHIHAAAIIKRTEITTDTFDTNACAIAFGDQLAIATASNELFCSQGVAVEEGSPYEYTIVWGYTNSNKGYLATKEAYDYHCYEAENSRFASGCAEEMTQIQINMLKELKGE